MNNEIKRTLLSLSRKLISDWTGELNKEIADLMVHSKPETLDSCYDLLDKIKNELDKLKGQFSS